MKKFNRSAASDILAAAGLLLITASVVTTMIQFEWRPAAMMFGLGVVTMVWAFLLGL
jgi:hypothetical protein